MHEKALLCLGRPHSKCILVNSVYMYMCVKPSKASCVGHTAAAFLALLFFLLPLCASLQRSAVLMSCAELAWDVRSTAKTGQDTTCWTYPVLATSTADCCHVAQHGPVL